MTANVVTEPGSRRELLANLGLGPGASDDEVEAAHDDIVRFLEDAPSSLRGWARARLSDADRTYAILNGGLPDSGSAARPAPALPLPTAIPSPAVRPAGPAGPAAPASHQKQRSNNNGRWVGGFVGRGRDRHARRAGRACADGRPDPRAEAPVAGAARLERPDHGQLPDWGCRSNAPVRPRRRPAGRLRRDRGGRLQARRADRPRPHRIAGPGRHGRGVDQAQAVTRSWRSSTTNPRDVTPMRALADLYYAAGDNATIPLAGS